VASATQRVFLTGASSGVGLALAEAYANRGATLGLAARNAAALQQFAARHPGLAIDIYPLDVREAQALRSAAQAFVARHGAPTVVIANAGVSAGTLTAYAEDVPRFQEIMDINVMGMVKTFQPFVAPMSAAGAGTLVGIASVAGFRGLPGAQAYCASKAAAISYLESLRAELRPSGVRVVTICPGYIATPMTQGNPYPMPFLMAPERAAESMVRIIERQRAFAVLPWQMAIASRVLKLLPNWLYDGVTGRFPHKPRQRNE
jgi:short-subunit dehydrogenase